MPEKMKNYQLQGARLSDFSRYIDRTKEHDMKRTPRLVTFTWLLLTMLIGCTTNDDDMVAGQPQSYTDKSLLTLAVYDGEWTVNKQIIDTARLVVGPTNVSVRFPHRYLADLYILTSNETDQNVGTAVNTYKATDIKLSALGYSEQWQYYALALPSIVGADSELLTVPCSFETTIADTPYSISLLCQNNASAMTDIATGQWTLIIPIKTLLVTNLSTGHSTLHKLNTTIVLYYNTRQQIN